MADRLSRRKLANILRTGADAVLTANAGCLLQIAAKPAASGNRSGSRIRWTCST